MDISLERSRRIVEAMKSVGEAVSQNEGIEGLETAKRILKDLAAQRDLFPENHFPWPAAGVENVMYCIYRKKGEGPALYLDLLHHGASNAPHDHGNSWAIVVGMEGQERHNLFRRIDACSVDGHAELQPAGHLDIGPGDAVSLMAKGIHSISAVGSGRLMMMHCYARPFDEQDSRLEYDIPSRTCSATTAATGEIRNVPLDARVQA